MTMQVKTIISDNELTWCRNASSKIIDAHSFEIQVSPEHHGETLPLLPVPDHFLTIIFENLLFTPYIQLLILETTYTAQNRFADGEYKHNNCPVMAVVARARLANCYLSQDR
jgi:hypothetical protein